MLENVGFQAFFDCVKLGILNFTLRTQKQLSEQTGIYQADISKIERGLANPSLSTLKRLADGMGLKLRIAFEMK